MCGLFTECSIVDGDINQHVEDLKPTNVTGFFYYPISCNGTLVSINAHGFCPKTNMTVVLVIFIVNFQNNTPINIEHTRHSLEAECDTTEDGLGYYKGKISTRNQTTIKVSSDEYLIIRYTRPACKQICIFQPAIVNESTKHTLYFTKNLSPGEQQANMSLLFSATILSGKTKLVYTNQKPDFNFTCLSIGYDDT